MRQKLLVIDDSPTVASLVQLRLADEPIDVMVAGDGTSGLAMASEHRPDLILLDTELPASSFGGGDGYVVCRELKSRTETMAIPVIFLAGSAGTEEKLGGLELGALDFLDKPFDTAELKARVGSALRMKYLLDLLSTKAQIDVLSGLWNRNFFESRLGAEMSLARRTGAPLSIVLADVDQFARINSAHGHSAGDEAIRLVGHLFADTVRTEDVVCRWGGEKFAVVLPNTSPDRAVVVAERMRQRLAADALQVSEAHVPVTASFAVAAAVIDLETTTRHAEEALIRAKRNGRNRIEIATNLACFAA
jgi:two-component system cell cycle response regulator